MGEAESVFAIWHDPTTYDHMRVGPSYLPAQKMARKAGVSMYELGGLLACLRAASQLHQSNHWRTKGQAFYGDHLLFMRLYEDGLEFIDQVAERTVGQGSPEAVDPTTQAQQILAWCGKFLDGVEPTVGPEACVASSLNAERIVCQCIDEVYKSLEATGRLSSGTDNLLQGVADLHEGFVYLLQQRNSTKLGSYDRRAKNWSAGR